MAVMPGPVSVVAKRSSFQAASTLRNCLIRSSANILKHLGPSVERSGLLDENRATSRHPASPGDGADNPAVAGIKGDGRDAGGCLRRSAPDDGGHAGRARPVAELSRRRRRTTAPGGLPL